MGSGLMEEIFKRVIVAEVGIDFNGQGSELLEKVHEGAHLDRNELTGVRVWIASKGSRNPEQP
jgi:hypothetical protein